MNAEKQLLEFLQLVWQNSNLTTLIALRKLLDEILLEKGQAQPTVTVYNPSYTQPKVQEWLSKLPEAIRDLAMTNILEQERKFGRPVIDRPYSLKGGFIWSLTPEKEPFWKAVQSALIDPDKQWPAIPNEDQS